MCYLALLCIFWFVFLAFFGVFLATFDFTMILCVLSKFLDTTCFYCLMDGIHADFTIFGSIYEQ